MDYKPTASNRLFHGDCKSLEEAIKLQAVAFRAEASDYKSFSHADDFQQAWYDDLIKQAEVCDKLLHEYQDTVVAATRTAEETLLMKWSKCSDETTKNIADAGKTKDWSLLAI
ncbi:hypothetical protein [Hymenobacter sp. YC55]|uniref:hypothetical protein n=1 Tax=Hymenobacter sp. YC55 TaxID=3034019 RepID=UPI0023F7A4E2|nr:hypothetical protein [Hymenobacter sp. YC55]MDF7810723.1 hypothetical protein [Hymenobacter sp. YC55]